MAVVRLCRCGEQSEEAVASAGSGMLKYVRSCPTAFW